MSDLNQQLHELFREKEAVVGPPPSVPPALSGGPRGTRGRRWWSWVPVTVAVFLMALIVVGVNVLRSDHTAAPPPLAGATSPGATPGTTDVSTALLGTWQLVAWHGKDYPLRPSLEMRSGPLVTFKTDGTWDGSDGCNNLDGTYLVGADGTFAFTTNGTTLMLCAGVDPVPVPAEGAVSVTVAGSRSTFVDGDGEEVAKYRRPGAALVAEATLVTRLGVPALALSAYRSSNCPLRIKSISVGSHNQLLVNLAGPDREFCTKDVKQTTDVGTIPGSRNLDPEQPITATLRYPHPGPITILVQTPAAALVGESGD